MPRSLASFALRSFASLLSPPSERLIALPPLAPTRSLQVVKGKHHARSGRGVKAILGRNRVEKRQGVCGNETSKNVAPDVARTRRVTRY